jgi:hypothetical protein
MGDEWKARQIVEVSALRNHLREFMSGEAGAEMALAAFFPAVGALEVRLWHLEARDG